jgi:integrase
MASNAASLPATGPTGPAATIADVLALLEADTALPPTRRRDLMSALRRLCALLGRDPAVCPADIGSVRRMIGTIRPEQAGMGRTTWHKRKSDALAALRWAKAHEPKASSKGRLTPAWLSLMETLGDKHRRAALSRLVGFCSRCGIEPDAVTDAVINRFMDWIRDETFAGKPNELHRRTCKAWNGAADTVPGWPANRLSVPSYRKPRQSLPITAFPETFQAEVQKHREWLLGRDPFATHPPPKACRPRTVHLRVRHIELAASALVHRGRDPATIRSLVDLVAVEAVNAIMRHYLEKDDGNADTFTRGLCKALVLIAKHWSRVSPDRLAALKDIQRRLGSDRTGLTDKNRACLRQFDDERNVALLLTLPALLIEQAKGQGRDDVRAAVLVQVAVAIEILLMAPIRAHNLIGLRLDRHIVRPGGPRGPVHIVIPGNEAKGGDPLEYPLPEEAAEILDLYLVKYRPLLCSTAEPWLFPSTGGGRKAQATLSQQISGIIRKQTGLVMTVHQFRHVAAKLALSLDPGNFEGVKQLLGHANSKTTTGFYTGIQSASAARHYDALLSRLREELPVPPTPRRGSGKHRA